jgi:hypothetical protein
MLLIGREIRCVILGHSAALFVCIFVPENYDEINQLSQINAL